MSGEGIIKIVIMIRLQPTTITLTASEMTDAERHSRYRKHLANRECTTRTRWSTALENEETTLEHAMNTRIQTPDTDPSNRQRIRSSPSPDVLAREEDFTYSTSSAGNGIDREVGAVRLPIRTRFANVINDTIHQDDNEGRTVQQLLTTVVSRPLGWNVPLFAVTSIRYILQQDQDRYVRRK